MLSATLRRAFNAVKAKFRCPGQGKDEMSALCQERTLMRTICGNQRGVGQLDWTNPASVDDPALKLEHEFLPEALIRLAANLDFNNVARCSPKPRNAVGDGDDVLMLVASPQANKLVQKKIRVGAAGVPHLHRRN